REQCRRAAARTTRTERPTGDVGRCGFWGRGLPRGTQATSGRCGRASTRRPHAGFARVVPLRFFLLSRPVPPWERWPAYVICVVPFRPPDAPKRTSFSSRALTEANERGRRRERQLSVVCGPSPQPSPETDHEGVHGSGTPGHGDGGLL